MKVLIIDDDVALANVLAFTLQRNGFDVIQAYDGSTGLQRCVDNQPDLIILEVNLPKMSGVEVCRQIRSMSDVPIILLTEREIEEDIVNGFKIGADDYIIKPFSPKQLIARMNAILRRSAGKLPATELRVGDLRLFPNRRELILGAQKNLSLTSLECNLLECLMRNADRELSFETLIDDVWGSAGADRDMLRQLVHHLRAKIEADASNPTRIQTTPGFGYKLIKRN